MDRIANMTKQGFHSQTSQAIVKTKDFSLINIISHVQARKNQSCLLNAAAKERLPHAAKQSNS